MSAPARTWWSAAEIAEARLPEMPDTTRGVSKLAARLDWRADKDHARRRAGRGGGWEYHWKLFPLAAQKVLSGGAARAPARHVALTSEEAWAAFEALPERVRARARERLAALQMVEAMVAAGQSRSLAVSEAGRVLGHGARTIWSWFAQLEGVARSDWLAHLAPRHRLAARPVRKRQAPEFMARLKSDYLRLSQPSFSACWRRAQRYCQAKGFDWLPERSARRRLMAEVPRVTRVFAREGEAGLARCFPAQIRSRAHLGALEWVDADFHKFDVFVRWPDGTVSRPQMVAFHDIYSGKVLSWRIDWSPNKVAVAAAWGDMVEEYGLPEHVLFDNGREFANKWMTGGARTRFRFKLIEGEPLGILALCGVKIHWATPGHGQAKPVERTFRDFADAISRDPRFEGAWVGNRPDAKPENYASRAIELEDFIRVVADGINEHNARPGRRSETARGRSFDEVFAESYATRPIRRASEAQKRIWLMGQELRKAHAGSGRVTLAGNTYWSAWMNEYAGQELVLRFDPEDLHAGVHVYDKVGQYLGFGACEVAAGFDDYAAARKLAADKARIRKAERKLVSQHRELSASELGGGLDEVACEAPPQPDAKVVRGQFGKNKPKAARMQPPQAPKPAPDAQQAARDEAFQATFVPLEELRRARAQERPAPSLPDLPPLPSRHVEEETPGERYVRACEVAARLEAGQPVGEAEARWLEGYRTSSEYRAEKAIRENAMGTRFGA